jgi:outer membrane lipoprotein carrier protein
MKFVRLATAAALASSTAAAQTARPDAGQVAAPTAEQVAARVDAFYRRVVDFDATFTQSSRQRLTGQAQQRAGRLRVRQPDRVRWDYSTGDVIVSDGTTLWVYEAAARQAMRCAVGSASRLAGGLPFLSSAPLGRDYVVALAARPTAPLHYVLVLTPRRPTPGVAQVELYVDRGTYQVARVVVWDHERNRNQFDIAPPRVNVGSSPALYPWSPPAGTRVVAQGVCP